LKIRLHAATADLKHQLLCKPQPISHAKAKEPNAQSQLIVDK